MNPRSPEHGKPQRCGDPAFVAHERRVRRYTAWAWIPLTGAGLVVGLNLGQAGRLADYPFLEWLSWGVAGALGAWLVGLPVVYYWPRTRGQLSESLGILWLHAAAVALVAGGFCSLSWGCGIAFPTFVLCALFLTLSVVALKKRSAWRDRCYHCGYSLIGLTIPRCPECGERVSRRRLRRLRRIAATQDSQ